MLNYTIDKNRVQVSLSWRKTTFNVYLYDCNNVTYRLLDEVSYRGLKPDQALTLIPVDLIENPLQLLQGSIYYTLYSNRLQRIRNKGLLLALFILGCRQLNELIESLENSISKSSRYYVVGVDVDLANKAGCVETALHLGGEVNVSSLVKNTRFLLSVI